MRGARLLDGTGAPPRENVAILILEGRIAAIGPDAEIATRPDAGGVRQLDVGGATVLPGLVDAHVHLESVLGSEIRADSAPQRTRLRRQQLRSYLACGVTTVLDTAIHPEVLSEIRTWLGEGEPGPSFLTLGPPIPAAGGYMSFGYPGLAVSRPEDLERNFTAIEGARTFGVKVPIERGFGVDIFPIHSPEVRAAIVAGAKARGLPILVHASDEVEQTIALDMGAYALLHLNFGGSDPTPTFVERVASARTFVVTTFSIIDADLTRFEPARLDDPLIRVAVPAEEVATARDPEAWATGDSINIGYVYPWMPEFLRRFIGRRSANEEGLRRVLAVNLRAARTLHDRGIPIVIGSDAGNFVPAQFHGTSTLREIELLASAGVPPGEVLAAATTVPARMLHVEDQVGTVEVGKRADLVVVDGDPLVDPKVLRSVRWSVKSGVAHTPEQWMESYSEGADGAAASRPADAAVAIPSASAR